MNWLTFNSPEQLKAIIEHSFTKPCAIFKHSTRCSISSMAKMRLEDDWSAVSNDIDVYYLDLIAYRPISNLVAETFDVHHESPQVLLIQNGECTYDASHLDITVAELQEALVQTAQ